MKLKVGQIVYLRPNILGFAYRKDKSIKTSTITRVGRKYIKVDRFGDFDIATGKEKSSGISDYELFLNKKDLDLALERDLLIQRIKEAIPKYGQWDISIDKIREIVNILDS